MEAIGYCAHCGWLLCVCLLLLAVAVHPDDHLPRASVGDSGWENRVTGVCPSLPLPISLQVLDWVGCWEFGGWCSVGRDGGQVISCLPFVRQSCRRSNADG